MHIFQILDFLHVCYLKFLNEWKHKLFNGILGCQHDHIHCRFQCKHMFVTMLITFSLSILIADTRSTFCEAILSHPLCKGGLIGFTPLSRVLGLWLPYGHWLLAHGLQLSSFGVGEEEHVGYASPLENSSQFSYLELLFNPHFIETWFQRTPYGTTISKLHCLENVWIGHESFSDLFHFALKA